MNERALAGDSTVPDHARERAARVGAPEGIEAAALVEDSKAVESAEYLRSVGVSVGIATTDVVGGIRSDGICPLTTDEKDIAIHPLALVIENPVRCPTCEKWVERHMLVNGDCPIAINMSISGELKGELRAKHNPAHDAIAPLQLPRADLSTDEGKAQLAAGDEPAPLPGVYDPSAPAEATEPVSAAEPPPARAYDPTQTVVE